MILHRWGEGGIGGSRGMHMCTQPLNFEVGIPFEELAHRCVYRHTGLPLPLLLDPHGNQQQEQKQSRHIQYRCHRDANDCARGRAFAAVVWNRSKHVEVSLRVGGSALSSADA